MLFIKKYPQWYEKTAKIFFLFSSYSCEVRFSSCISTKTTYYKRWIIRRRYENLASSINLEDGKDLQKCRAIIFFSLNFFKKSFLINNKFFFIFNLVNMDIIQVNKSSLRFSKKKKMGSFWNQFDSCTVHQDPYPYHHSEESCKATCCPISCQCHWGPWLCTHGKARGISIHLCFS